MAQIWWFIFLGLELAKCWYSLRGPTVAMKYGSSVTFLGWWWVYGDPVFVNARKRATFKGIGKKKVTKWITWILIVSKHDFVWILSRLRGGGSFFFSRLMAQRATRTPQMGIFTFAPQSVSSEHFVQQNSSVANKGWYTHRLAQKLLQGWHFRYIFPPYPLTNWPWTLETQSWWRNSFHSVNGFFRFL